jgi:site-specific DNA-methyltransferase (cytosine-N4-specific)
MADYLNQCHFGDCIETMRGMPSGIVQACVTSPPYFGLRDYGHDGQIGLEDRAPDYVKKLISVFDQVHKLLAHDGVLFVNIGDTYAGFKDGKFPPQSQSKGDQRGLPVSGAPHRNKKLLQLDGFKDKELMGIPWRFAFAMQDAGWYLRQEIIWSKPNYTPEKVRDRFVKSHEHIFFFSKQPKYKFDGDAVRVPSAAGGTKLRSSVWSVPVSSYKGAHFATFPVDLIEPCILGGTDVGDVVLDPFMGSGTTAYVAKSNGRQFIGCELNPAYKALQDERLQQPSFEFMEPA